ncbi:allantoate amidohydrolase [Gulosibacter faecalis]|jgi:N-carbamoyl-L-amino-acid hydrolase|uniref:Allantoate amidohydrolase n=1 Tax=Gulosibacter faecalis TaxID=272240 RepID=A0ABW5UZ70_9MICO|nr:allantoate amidohydrolase [Gulosibacter faecalis]
MSTPTADLLAELADIGRDPVRGGYTRPGLGEAELELRAWFMEQAARRGLEVELDRNGIVWAWWLPEGSDRSGAVITGSHLDSVPGGGAYDGPLGVVSALRAFDLLREGAEFPTRPLALVVFPEEEGSRFGVPCLGSRLVTGALTPERARSLTDADGATFPEAARTAGIDPDTIGPDPERFADIHAFVELHVEQGRGLEDLGQPVAIGRSILAHGRWHVEIHGRGDHAGTTRMQDRHDPMVALADAILAVREAAEQVDEARGTVGRLRAIPGGTNVIASRADLWFDLRHRDESVVRELLARITERIRAAGEREGCTVEVHEESFSGEVRFDPQLRTRLEAALPDAPVLDTGAGHDAGVLASVIPTGMLYVRNPSGTSHAPDEGASDDDAEAGSVALATALEALMR